MKDLLYHHVKIKEGEPGYKEGELLYHYVKMEDTIKETRWEKWETEKEKKYYDYNTKN